VKLEVLAEALPLPILLESRRRGCSADFARLDALSIETLLCPCIKSLLATVFHPEDTLYVARERRSWGKSNILLVRVVYDHRSWPIYWEFIDKKGSSNLLLATKCFAYRVAKRVQP